ncbi:MAG TPA: hypothetical protein VGD37_12055 [Kofleriaceae bacterium]|jgi:DNA-binding helix-hairpin-helix protein with protein kinase domain
MAAQQLFDHAGRSLGLGPLIRRGGEGAVFDVIGQPTFVAKLYESDCSPDKADKLRSMITAGSTALQRIAAWPVTTLHDRPHGRIRGFVMPKVAGYKEVHKLYGPGHRQREFPDADWAFLVHTAANCAAAFETVHAMNHLMGDVNPGNVLVSPQALVALIDCDSFQVQSSGRTFRCEVGVPEYTPPELQGVLFRDVDRTENHDRFGLAVLIFHLLFMGRHPFAGRYPGPDDMSLDRAIRECRFPFSLRAEGRKGMEPPPLAPALDIATTEIAKLFDQAFQDPGYNVRPSAAEWHSALSSLERQLVACSRERAHKYVRHAPGCPWCRFEDGAPAVLFFVSPTSGLEFLCSVADLAPVLAPLERIPRPQKTVPQGSSPIAVQPVPPSSATLTERKRSRIAQAALAASALVVLTGLIVLVFMAAGLPVAIVGVVGAIASGGYLVFLARTSELAEERRRRRLAVSQAQAAHEQWTAAWLKSSERPARAYSETRSRVDAFRIEYATLRSRFDADVSKLEQSKEAAQRRDYLRNEYIAEADIKGIGSNVKNALLSEGIETALDVLTRGVDGVPGVGEKRRAAFVAWAEDVASAFRFDPRKDVPAAERRVLVAKYRQRQIQIRGQLERQIAELREFMSASAGEVDKARAALTAATTRLAQAQVDLVALD